MKVFFLALFSFLFYADISRSESAQIALQSTRSLTAAMQSRERMCQQLRQNPNCAERDNILQQVSGLSVVSCRAKVSSPQCTRFFNESPELRPQAMSCTPAEICRLGLESTLLRGCRNYGIEVKESFLNTLQQQLNCAQSWRCVLNQEVSLALAFISPGLFVARQSQNISNSLVQTFKADRDKLKNLECLNPETQTQFMCYLAVQYGGAVLGAAGAARAVGAGLMGRMAQLEVKLGLRSRVAASLAARRLEGTLSRLTNARVLIRDGGFRGSVLNRPVSPGQYILVHTKSMTRTGALQERLTLIESSEGVGPSATVRRLRADNEDYIPGHRTSVGRFTIGADGQVNLGAADNLTRAGDIDILNAQLRRIGIRP